MLSVYPLYPQYLLNLNPITKNQIKALTQCTGNPASLSKKYVEGYKTSKEVLKKKKNPIKKKMNKHPPPRFTMKNSPMPVF